MDERIFLLATKPSKNRKGTTYCIGVFRLGTPNMEFIMGETDNDRRYRAGEEVTYIYDADYTSDLKIAMKWLDNMG